MTIRPAFTAPCSLSPLPQRSSATSPRRARFYSIRACSGAPSSPTPARSPSVAAGAASPFPPALAALVREQVAEPIFAMRDMSLPDVARAAQAASPPAFLSDEDLESCTGGGRVAASLLRDKRQDIISVARAAIYAAVPGIEGEGGALWPAFRAEACWRDMENFLRVIQYGCVCGAGQTPWLSGKGCVIMAAVYKELEVPLEEMLVGVRAAAEYVTSDLLQVAPEVEREASALAFADLVSMMHAMRSGEIATWAETSARSVK